MAKAPFRVENKGGQRGGRDGQLFRCKGQTDTENIERRLFQVLHRSYWKRGVSLEATVRSSILDVLGLRFLWDFSVHSFLPKH